VVAERGPRTSAPEQALAGFLRKHGAAKEDLVREGDFWVLNKQTPAQSAAAFIAAALPELLAKLPWPKSMRWGSGGEFTWVRPLRRIVCLLDGEVVPFTLGPVMASNITEGHRVHGKGPFEVSSAAVWEEKLREHCVIADQGERRAKIAEGIAGAAARLDLTVAPDEALLDEVTGLVEYPVPLIGQIDPEFMELPPEVRELSMKINQKYFALRDAAGKPAPYFAFVANLAADDEGKAIIAGNERVLRARLSDARHFWQMDTRSRLDAHLPKLSKVVFQANLGSQRDRVERLVGLSSFLYEELTSGREKLVQSTSLEVCRRSALLSKCDLTTGMVGEFPELQGIVGGYYAAVDREPVQVAKAISEHYRPKGPGDLVPSDATSVILALADKVDIVAAFFAVGIKPTGSQDPFALRRACLGIIRIIIENEVRVNLNTIVGFAAAQVLTSIYYSFQSDKLAKVEELKQKGVPHNWVDELALHVGGSVKAFDASSLLHEANANTDWHYAPLVNKVRAEVFGFIIERLRVKLRGEGKRFDVLDAVLAAGEDYDLVRLMKRVEALSAMLGSEDGKNLVAAYKRAANILRIENAKDGPHTPDPVVGPLPEKVEEELRDGLQFVLNETIHDFAAENYAKAMAGLAKLRSLIDAFFENVTVNADAPDLRRNRLRLLARFTGAVDQVADFSRIEG
jgi:glycyl-tRNA synthetase beta chain